MGDFVQKVLPGRDSQKGYGIKIKRLLLPALLCLFSVGLLFDLALRQALFWFPPVILTAVVSAFLWYKSKRKRYSLEALIACMLLVAGVVQFSGQAWLHIVFLPSIVTLAIFFKPAVILPVALTVPFLEIKHFLIGNPREEALLSGAVLFAGLAVSAVVSRLKAERAKMQRTLEGLRKEAEDADFGTLETGSSNDRDLSRYLSSERSTDEEVRDILAMAQHAFSARTASFVVRQGETLRIRSTTDAAIERVPEGVTSVCMEKRQTVSAGSARPGEGPSALASPVLDGTYLLGALVVSSERPLWNPSKEAAELFAKQIGKVLRRQRVYTQLQREHLMLKQLKEGTSRLATSLKTADIAQSLIEAVYSIVPQERVSIALFAPKEDGMEVIRQIGFTLREGEIFELKGTRIGVLSRSGEADYISDLRKEKNPLLPFRIEHEGSLLMMPLSYEKELLGILVFLSRTIDAVHPYEIELLKVLADQAASSLANARFHAEIERLAVTDGLTGLFNHRTFQERLSDEFRRLERFADSLSLLLIDIDFFKKVNDTYGHPAGDEVLRSVARIIKEAVRGIDIPARYGGEEFAALLPGTGEDGALKMAERLRNMVKKYVVKADGRDIGVTVSIGIATAPSDARSKEELIDRADQSLYNAKRSGRDRCVAWKALNLEPGVRKRD